MPPGGTLSLGLTIPNVAAIVGATVFSQTLRLGSTGFDNVLRIPITPAAIE